MYSVIFFMLLIFLIYNILQIILPLFQAKIHISKVSFTSTEQSTESTYL